MIKKITTFLLSVMAVLTFAQAPDMFNYQAVIRDGSGEIVSETAISLRLSVLKGSASGQNVHQGDYAITTDKYGVVSVKIGMPDVSVGDFSTIDWGADSYFLKTEVDLAGGSDYTEMGTTQFVSVPYAIHSNTSDTADYAMSVGSVDDADADAQNEIQRLKLRGDTLFITDGNYVLLGGIGGYITTCYSSDTASWWNQGNLSNFSKEPPANFPDDRTEGSGISDADWKQIFGELGISESASGGDIPESINRGLGNQHRFSFYQTSVGYFGIEVNFEGVVSDRTASASDINAAIAAMNTFTINFYQDEVLVQSFDKNEIEVNVYNFSGYTQYYFKLEKSGVLNNIGDRYPGIRYEVCLKK